MARRRRALSGETQTEPSENGIFHVWVSNTPTLCIKKATAVKLLSISELSIHASAHVDFECIKAGRQRDGGHGVKVHCLVRPKP